MTVDRLPAGWTNIKLSDAGNWTGGGTPSKSNQDYRCGSIPWVSPKDMKAGNIAKTKDQITENTIINSSAKLIPASSVLMATRSGILAHSFPVATNSVEVAINQDLKAIVPIEAIDSEYLAWLLRSDSRSILNQCTKQGRGRL